MTELDTVESVDGETIQSALFDAEEMERTSSIYLPGFEHLAELTGQPLFDDNEVIDAAFEYYRERGFPYRKLPRHVCQQQINQLAQTASENLLGTIVGYQVADTYHSHRFAAAATGKRSPVDSFESDKYLRMAIQKTLKYGAVGEEFLGILAVVAGTQACSNFRPGFALSYYRRFCRRGGEVVLDTSTGYGGRLVGFLASGTKGFYVGIDPNVPTHKANVAIMRDLGAAKGYRALLINLPAEDVSVDEIDWAHTEYVAPASDTLGPGGRPFIASLREIADFSFTSPPYFAKERYSTDETQSWVRYGDNPEHWRDEFLRPMLRLQFDALKAGAHSCINVADVVVNKMQAPLEEWTVEAAKLAGFEHIHTDKYRLNRRFGRGEGNGLVAYEPVFIFKKPDAPTSVVVPELPLTTNGHITVAISETVISPSETCDDLDCLHPYVKHDDEEGGDLSCLVRGCGCGHFKLREPEPLEPTPEQEPYTGRQHTYRDDPDSPGTCLKCELPERNTNAHPLAAFVTEPPIETNGHADIMREQVADEESGYDGPPIPEDHVYLQTADATLLSSCLQCRADAIAPWHIKLPASATLHVFVSSDGTAAAACSECWAVSAAPWHLNEAQQQLIASATLVAPLEVPSIATIPVVDEVNIACARGTCKHPISEHPEHRGCTVGGCNCKKFQDPPAGVQGALPIDAGSTQATRPVVEGTQRQVKSAPVAVAVPSALPERPPVDPKYSMYQPAPHHEQRLAVSNVTPGAEGRALRVECPMCGAPVGYWCLADTA